MEQVYHNIELDQVDDIEMAMGRMRGFRYLLAAADGSKHDFDSKEIAEIYCLFSHLMNGLETALRPLINCADPEEDTPPE